MVSWEELREALNKTLEELLAHEQEKLKYKGPYSVDTDDIWKCNAIPNFQKAIREISSARADSLSSGNIPEFARTLAERILAANNIKMNGSSDLFTRFCEATVRMYLEFTEQRILLNDEARSFQPAVRPTPVPLVSSAPDDKISPLISEVVEKYCNEMVAGDNWTDKTAKSGVHWTPNPV